MVKSFSHLWWTTRFPPKLKRLHLTAGEPSAIHHWWNHSAMPLVVCADFTIGRFAVITDGGRVRFSPE